MLEIPALDSSATTNIASVKRYAPPNQRNRSLGRRKSGGDRLERASSNSSDGEKNQISASRSTSALDDTGGRYQGNERHRTTLIPLQGCSSSKASQLLNNRWNAALSAYNNLPHDSPERPVLYTKRSPWGNAMLPHEVMSQAGGKMQKDFLSELRLAMRCTSASSDA